MNRFLLYTFPHIRKKNSWDLDVSRLICMFCHLENQDSRILFFDRTHIIMKTFFERTLRTFLSGYFYLFDIYTKNSCKQDPRHFDFDTLYNISLRCVFTEGQCLVVVHLNSPLPTTQPAAANSQNGDNKDEHHHQNHGSSNNAIAITNIFEEYQEIRIIAKEISW